MNQQGLLNALGEQNSIDKFYQDWPTKGNNFFYSERNITINQSITQFTQLAVDRATGARHSGLVGGTSSSEIS